MAKESDVFKPNNTTICFIKKKLFSNLYVILKWNSFKKAYWKLD